MSGVNTLEWNTNRISVLNHTGLIKLFKVAMQILFFVPVQLNRFLDSLDADTDSYRKHIRYAGLQNRSHPVPERVWQRRSALITMLDEQHKSKT